MKPKKRQVLIHDDEPSASTGWRDQLGKLLGKYFEVRSLNNDAFGKILNTLEARRSSARSSKKEKLAPCEIDDAGILIIDYDLLQSTNQQFLTGEAFAYLSRCYSSCGLIIVVNQFGGDIFDLTMLGHPESYADLNVGAKQLVCDGLWREPWRGFRSWHWPLMPQLLDNFEIRVGHIIQKLDQAIIGVLGLDEVSSSFSGPAAEFLQGTVKKPLNNITFRDFVVENRTNGLRYKDKPLNDETVARIAASRLSKWLERLILAGQDILVDAPHLVSRFPSLLSGSRNQVSSWNKTTRISKRAPSGIRNSSIRGFEYKHPEWLSRPAWFWPQVMTSKKILEVRNPFGQSAGIPDFVFCEDISRFLRREQAQEYIADLPSPFVRRYVARANSKKFKSLRDITYAPEVRFALT
jgi:hypothetical protein